MLEIKEAPTHSPAKPQNPVCWVPTEAALAISLARPGMLHNEVEQGQVCPGHLGLQPNSLLGVPQAFPVLIDLVWICEW